jgi:arginine decarboxylase
MRGWTIRDSLELYNLPAWGAGFFSINAAGHVVVHPRGNQGEAIDLLDLVRDLQGRDVRPPMLIRFSDILASRVKGLWTPSATPSRSTATGAYTGVCIRSR